MPASRIAFALADFVSEIRNLLPRDHKLGITVRLDTAAFDPAVQELGNHFNMPRLVPGSAPVDAVNAGGVRIERILPGGAANG